jgi:hypothetical protein
MSTDTPDTPRPEATVDASQARLLERLRAAGGGPVSFAELRSLGIENPAVLAYELDLVGMPIERVHRDDAPGRGVPVGVRIEEGDGATAAARTIAARSIAAAGAKRRPLAAPIALVAVAAAIALLALTSQAGRRVTAAAARTDIGTGRVAHAVLQPTRQAAQPPGGAARLQTHPIAPAEPAPAAGESKATSTRETAATGASPADRPGASESSSGRAPEQARVAGASSSAAQLQADGHQLLSDARYAAAIGDLRAALASSGQSVAGCAVPASETCLTYAYALYDLGHALRLSGDPGAAVGVLSERLQIDNQQSTVQEELGLARAAASAGSAAAPRPPAARTLDGGVRAPGDARREHA